MLIQVVLEVRRLHSRLPLLIFLGMIKEESSVPTVC